MRWALSKICTPWELSVNGYITIQYKINLHMVRQLYKRSWFKKLIGKVKQLILWIYMRNVCEKCPVPWNLVFKLPSILPYIRNRIHTIFLPRYFIAESTWRSTINFCHVVSLKHGTFSDKYLKQTHTDNGRWYVGYGFKVHFQAPCFTWRSCNGTVIDFENVSQSNASPQWFH